MKTKFYYLRDGRVPLVTVCLLMNDKHGVSRGIAVCSDDDNPCKKTGRGIALKRARIANGKLEDGKHISTLSDSTGKKLLETLPGIEYLQHCLPILLKHEVKMVGIADES